MAGVETPPANAQYLLQAVPRVPHVASPLHAPFQRQGAVPNVQLAHWAAFRQDLQLAKDSILEDCNHFNYIINVAKKPPAAYVIGSAGQAY